MMMCENILNLIYLNLFPLNQLKTPNIFFSEILFRNFFFNKCIYLKTEFTPKYTYK
jgi:hypothetical protein